MIINKTPFRISFFGGGTDYPEYFTKHGGAVLASAIDKFAYHTAHPLLEKFFDYSIRIGYSQVEYVKHLDEIQHVPFRECLRWTGITKNIEVDYFADLPSSVGLGTSSTFVVGLLQTLYAHCGRLVHPLELAYQAIELEREVLHETVGCQDQTLAAVGGLNLIEFHTTSNISVERIRLSPSRLQELEAHLLLVFTAIRRRASTVAARQINKVAANTEHLKRMRAMVDEGYRILTGSGSLAPFGELLHEAWMRKHQLDEGVSNPTIDEIYRIGREHGALGGKLLGAGGGGFMLFFVPPEKRPAVRTALGHLAELSVRLAAPGTSLIHAAPSTLVAADSQTAAA